MSARHPLRRKATAVPESYSPGVLAAIAFCPSPPLLVPELAAGAAAELDGLCAACSTPAPTISSSSERAR
jgi:hypothetical protein